MRQQQLARAVRHAPSVKSDPLAWQDFAACVAPDIDPKIFFVEGRGHTNRYDAARKVCAVCPVFVECRRWIDRLEKDRSRSDVRGMYAGETPEERMARRALEAA